MRLSRREHARLARELIEACGSLDEAASNCRVRRSVLSTYQSPIEDACMPADVIEALEEYSGRAIYSTALASKFADPLGDPRRAQDLVCELTERAADLQRIIRATKDLTTARAAVLDQVLAEIQTATDVIARLRASALAAGVERERDEPAR